MLNPDIGKWVFASLAKFFSQQATALSLPFFAEGADDANSEVYQNTNLSMRVDGPVVHENSGWQEYRFEVQGLLTQVGVPSNVYTPYDRAGTIAEAMRSGIPIYKIPDNPSELFGCLLPDTRATETVRVVNLGILSDSSKVSQISVVGKYQIES